MAHSTGAVIRLLARQSGKRRASRQGQSRWAIILWPIEQFTRGQILLKREVQELVLLVVGVYQHSRHLFQQHAGLLRQVIEQVHRDPTLADPLQCAEDTPSMISAG